MIVSRMTFPKSRLGDVRRDCPRIVIDISANAHWVLQYQNWFHVAFLLGYHPKRGCYFLRLGPRPEYRWENMIESKTCGSYTVSLWRILHATTRKWEYAWFWRCGYALHIKDRTYFLPLRLFHPPSWVPINL
jgi:hypothetical protein